MACRRRRNSCVPSTALLPRVSEGAASLRGWSCVDGVCGRLADGYRSSDEIGGTSDPVPVLRDVIGERQPPPAAPMPRFVKPSRADRHRGGRCFGELRWGKWMGLWVGRRMGLPASGLPGSRGRSWRAPPSSLTTPASLRGWPVRPSVALC